MLIAAATSAVRDTPTENCKGIFAVCAFSSSPERRSGLMLPLQLASQRRLSACLRVRRVPLFYFPNASCFFLLKNIKTRLATNCFTTSYPCMFYLYHFVTVWRLFAKKR